MVTKFDKKTPEKMNIDIDPELKRLTYAFCTIAQRAKRLTKFHENSSENEGDRVNKLMKGKHSLHDTQAQTLILSFKCDIDLDSKWLTYTFCSSSY